jgi:DNA-binding CsgD family transcriptional regulator
MGLPWAWSPGTTSHCISRTCSYKRPSATAWVIPHALEMRAIAQTGKRDFDAALKSLGRARRLAEDQGNIHTQVNGVALTARVHLCCGSPERAVEVLSGRHSRFTSPGMEGEYLATHALARACCGHTKEAHDLVKKSEAVSSHLDALALRNFARSVASHFERGSLDSTLATRAFATTHETGNYDAFVCAYRAFPELLSGLTSNSDQHDRLSDLICSLDPALATKAGLRAPQRPVRSREKLTRREREIFDLVKQGSSNRAIARTLWISESTVKVHVHHILKKLGARTRTEAAGLELED